MGGWSLYKLLEVDVVFFKLLPRQLGFTRKKRRHLAYFLLSLPLVGHCLTLCFYIDYVFLEEVKLLFSPLQKYFTVITENTELKDEDKTCP